ncbi:MAG: hypothetical protein A2029_08370 [Chloroflexi bacterium RBG_19FT_COMBO_47_9]|nr:MAG: hypothetical protein A2029_08370 [Chloroflexi bacterium RBG_19FT_COMBO_47_9]
MEPNTPDQEIERGYLTDLVAKALKRPALQITDWKVQPIHGGVEWGSAVFRLQGEARDGNETISWSVILKTIKATEKAINQGGIWYWKREALAYQSGLLHHLPGGNISAPACYEVSERPDGLLWLWLEDIKDDVSSPWPIEQYALTARHLGQFNGAYLTGQSIPSDAWIAHNWLRMYVENAKPAVEFVYKNTKHPIVTHMLPGNTLAQFLAIWEEHDQILNKLESLPQVFSHQDAFRRNLFTRGGRTIAIDWGYMGNTPVGAELVALIAGSLGFFEIPAEQVMEMDRLCFEGYLQGLRDAGWNGDPKIVRTGYAVSLMLRYPIGGQIGEMLPTFLDQEGRSRMETAFENKSADELEKSDPAIVAYYEKVLPEALQLLGMKQQLSIVFRIGFNMLKLRISR